MVDANQSIFHRLRMEGYPVANSLNVTTCERARFTVLTPRLIRLEWSPTSQFEDRGTYAFPNRYVESAGPLSSQEWHRPQLKLRTNNLCLTYIDDGQPFNATNLSIEFLLNGEAQKWTPGMANSGNLRGTTRTLDLCAGGTNLQEGLLSRDGWVLVDDSGLPVWDSDDRWVAPRPDQHTYDWYFFGYGHDYKGTLRDYMQFGGPIPLIPRYVLGLWWSRYWAYHASDLMQLVKDFELHDIPLDVLVVDMDWHTPKGWTGYSWNRELFPEPETFLGWVHDQNLLVTLNLHPAEGIQSHEDSYEQFAELMGRDPALGEGVAFRPTDKAFVQPYFELLHHPLEEQGVDFWWLDWQQGESTDIKNLDPLSWLNHLHFQDSGRRGTRPMLYSRWGGLGNHRYPIGFSGDTYPTWDALRFQPYFTATAANVGFGWWSHDIGGHLGTTDPELYVRWVQFGAVSPCLRLHSSKNPLAERRPWAFPTEVYEAARAAIQFRYQLLPYLYSVARSASRQGLSLCTPMYYEHPDVEDSYYARGQYFLGDQVIAAPIVNPVDTRTGMAISDVWIPEGTWIEYSTLETFSGPRWVRLYGDLNRIPLFAKAGAIIPLAPPLMRTKAFDGSHLILQIFPGAEGQFELYEDDGSSQAYQHGIYETTLIKTSPIDDHTLNISIGAAQGHCPVLAAKRTFELHLKGVRSANRIVLNQMEHSAWGFDLTTGDLIITIQEAARQLPLEITVENLPANSTLIPTVAQSGAPFAHFIDYEIYEEAKNQLGTAIVAPAFDETPFDVELEWTLQRGSVTMSTLMTLKNCTSRQIIHSPIADEASLLPFRWSVAARIDWQGHAFQYSYQSRDAYPSINRWNTLIYNRDQAPLSFADVISPDGNLNLALAWHVAAQSTQAMRNIKQPFEVVLLEDSRHRILDGEPLEACLHTTLVSQSWEQVTLYVECIGEQRCYLNGTELSPTGPVEHSLLDSILSVPTAQERVYFNLSLRPGSNDLVIFTRPKASAGWWGIGATVFDASGKVFTGVGQ